MLIPTVAYILPWCIAAVAIPETSKFGLYPSLFKVVGTADPFAKHELIFAVKQLNMDILLQRLHTISDITSPEYGHYLSREEIGILTRNPTATESVVAYLQSKGVVTMRTTRHGEFVIASASIYVWEEMFQTVFYRIVNGKKSPSTSPTIVRRSTLRAKVYSVPKEIDSYLLSVLNTVQTPIFESKKRITSGTAIPNAIVSKMSSTSTSTSSSNKNKAYVTGFTYPKLLNEFYNITSNIGSELTTQSVFETSGQTFSTVDMAIFENTFSIPISQPVGDINDHIINTACKGVRDCAEANLDMQYLMAISQKTPTT